MATFVHDGLEAVICWAACSYAVKVSNAAATALQGKTCKIEFPK